MVIARVVVFASLLAIGPALAEEKVKLPPEVTPAMRAACETDVRRLCIKKDPTVDKVKRCVLAKFFQLGGRCQAVLVASGLMN